MKIKAFAVEQWMNKYEDGAKYNIAETCVDSVSLDELFELTGEDKNEFLSKLCSRRLTYGDIEGAPEFLEGICRMYKKISPEGIITTHGASGANHHVFYSLISPGDRVVSVMPTYQQLYSIPESFGAEMAVLQLREEDGYLPDLDRLKALVSPGTKMICINNPNNPTGALMSNEMLAEIADIARSAGAWLMCDETYRHLNQGEGWCDSVADIYEKGISVSSMSKVFSLAGLRQGWIAFRDPELRKAFLGHRDYTLISCGVFDEMVSALALKHSGMLIARNKRIIRENLALLDSWVKSQPRLSYVKPMAGTTALVHYDYDIPSDEFCDRLYRETGAFVVPGDCFEQPKSFRTGYACDKKVLSEGLAAFDTFLASL
ncbi:MAG: aminotransferase [Candidatus Limivicinus sp.]|jgi:aspartate/methionine/tyrosine aminotransferase